MSTPAAAAGPGGGMVQAAPSLWQREPAVLRTTIVAVLTALINFVVVMGWWHLTKTQEQSAVAVVTAIGGLIAALVVRQSVTPA